MGKGKDEEKITKSAESQNLPLPDWIKNKPTLHIGLEFYYIAFMELTSCRQVGMGEGPIPWTAMRTYCVTYEVLGNEFDRFTAIMGAMDDAYLTERQKK